MSHFMEVGIFRIGLNRIAFPNYCAIVVAVDKD